MRSLRVSFLFLLFVAVFLGSLEAKQPNFVIISASNLGYSDLGCYGSEIKTPAIDKLAAEGIQFTQFYSCGNSALSQTSLLTGQYPHRVGMGFPMVELKQKGYLGSITNATCTLAEFLKSIGYETFISGKWELTRHYQVGTPSHAWPLSRGFDRFFGTIQPQPCYFEPANLIMNQQPYDFGEDFYFTYEIAKEAAHFLDRAKNGGHPFFLHVAFSAPGWPLQAPEQEIKQYALTYKYGWDSIRADRFKAMQKIGILSSIAEFPPRDSRVFDWGRVGAYAAWHARRMEVYAAQVSALDRGVAMIMQKLKQIGAVDDTVVIFLSTAGASGDELSPQTVSRSIPSKTHTGEPTQVGNVPNVMPGSKITYQSYGVPWANVSNTPLRGYADSLYEGGISSPCIIRWNDHTEPGLVKEPAHIMDIFPTVVELTERPYPSELRGFETLRLRGESLVPLFSVKYRLDLRTNEKKRNRLFFWEYKGNAAVRYGDWKLVFPRNGQRWELYNLNADRMETTDVFIRFQKDPAVEHMIYSYEQWKAKNRVENWDVIQAQLKPKKKKK